MVRTSSVHELYSRWVKGSVQVMSHDDSCCFQLDWYCCAHLRCGYYHDDEEQLTARQQGILKCGEGPRGGRQLQTGGYAWKALCYGANQLCQASPCSAKQCQHKQSASELHLLHHVTPVAQAGVVCSWHLQQSLLHPDAQLPPVHRLSRALLQLDQDLLGLQGLQKIHYRTHGQSSDISGAWSSMLCRMMQPVQMLLPNADTRKTPSSVIYKKCRQLLIGRLH